MLTPFFSDILGFIDRGGEVVWAIAVACLMLWTLIIERFWFIRFTFQKKLATILSDWHNRSEHDSWRAQQIRAMILSRHRAELTESLDSIRMLIALCPLLGLLGTVTGMVMVFDVIAFTGNSDAQAMASGISRATIPTMAGLAVALTGFYPNVYLGQLARRSADLLEDAMRQE